VYLQRLTVRNFRAFREASIDLPETGLVLLAGPNSVGKSSLLSAIDVVAGQDTPPNMRHMAGGEVSIHARFALTDLDREGLHILRKYNDYIEKEVAGWLEWKFIPIDANSFMATSICLPWRYGKVIELARAQVTQTETKYQILAGPEIGPDVYNQTLGLTGAPVKAFESIGNIPDLTEIVSLLARWRASYFHFPAVRGGNAREDRMYTDTTLAQSGQNLGAVLLELKINKPELWAELQNLVASILPEVGILEISAVSPDRISIGFADPQFTDYRHNLRDLGAGVEQILLTAVLGIANPQARLVAIEEPETALHPEAQRAMAALFRRRSNDRTFVLTTHSPIFLDGGGSRSAIHLLSRSAGASEIRPANPELIDVLEALGARPSDVLSADRLLLVEGTSDRDVLTAWWPELVENQRVAVIIGEGGRNARFADLLDQWIAKADRLGRRILYIRDRDELTNESARRYSEQNNVYLLQRREMENYLLEADALVDYFARQDPNAAPINPIDVGAVMRAAADELRRVVVIKSVAERLGGTGLVNDRLRPKLAKQVQNVDDMVAAIIPLVRTPGDIEQQIRDDWDRIEAETSARWETDWNKLAPGEEILDKIFKEFLGRKYGKTADAGDLARCMGGPPREIAEVISSFLSD
jgi:predicted ATPase